MKKILSILVLIAAFCMTGFAQSAPKTAKKAMLMGDNAQVKDVKTGEVLRVAKATKQVPAVNGTIQMKRNGVSTPSNNTTNPANNGKGFKNMKEVREMTAPEMQMKEGTKKPAVVGKAGEPAKNMKKPENCQNVIKQKGAAQSSTNFKPNSSSKKQSRVIPKNIVILKEQ